MQYQNAEYIASFGTPAQLPEANYPEIVFAGRSNVGKSSLLNCLFQKKKLARVSASPGKTATINFYAVSHTYFVDLPGYGYAKLSKNERMRLQRLIEGYFAKARDWLLVILLMDIRRDPSPLDLQMIDFFIAAELPFLILLTKSDKVSKKEKEKQIADKRRQIPYGNEITMLPFSSVTGEGAQALKAILDELTQDVHGKE